MKQWRITEEQFYKKLKEECIKGYYDHLEYVKSLEGRYEKEKFEKSSRFVSDLMLNMIKMYIDKDDQDAIISSSSSIILNDVQKWTERSQDYDMPLEDIMFWVLCNTVLGKNHICITYACNNPNLTPDFIEDMIYVLSGVFKFEEWDDYHVNLVTNELKDVVKDKPRAEWSDEFVFEYIRSQCTSLYIPIDWYSIGGNPNLTPEFKEKYGSLLSKGKSLYEAAQKEAKGETPVRGKRGRYKKHID